MEERYKFKYYFLGLGKDKYDLFWGICIYRNFYDFLEVKILNFNKFYISFLGY